MSLRFQADADLDPAIGRGLRRREPSIDFRAAAGVIPDSTPDPEVLGIAAGAGRVLISRDVSTMPGHFEQFIQTHDSPGLLLVRSQRPIGSVIEGLLLGWISWTEEDLRASMVAITGARHLFGRAISNPLVVQHRTKCPQYLH